MMCPGCNQRPAHITAKEWDYCDVCVPKIRGRCPLPPATARVMANADPFRPLAQILEEEERLRG